MKKSYRSLLLERNGAFYYQGYPVRVGDILMIKDNPWKVLGGGQSNSKSQTPYLWVKHETYGTSIFAPSLGDTSPHQKGVPVMDVRELTMTAA